MRTIKFKTHAKGRIIEIPEEYPEFASRHLKVKISVDDVSSATYASTRKKMTSMVLNTRNFKFDRQEANQR